jgi:putative membrane protein
MSDITRQAAEQDTDPRVDLAVQRTELAEDRTLLAWIRTTIGLMGAGVAFDKGAQFLHEERLASGAAFVKNSHLVGLTLTAASTLLLLFVLLQYRKSMERLSHIKGGAWPGFSPSMLAAVLLILLGIGVFALLIAKG